MIDISKKLLSKVGKTNAKYKMIQKNDRILLGLSGGKDSLALAHVLKHIQNVSPDKFEFKAVTLSYGMGENYDYLTKHCNEHGIEHEVIDSSIFEISKEKIRQNSSFCSFFSRMRRGYLYTYAINNNFNKLAIAHHLDDAAESFFMNFTYNGALRTLAPKYKAKNGIEVIRPFIFVRERALRENAIRNNLTVVGDEACPAMRFDVKMPHARAETKALLASLEKENPKLFLSLKAAFENIHTDTFFN
ncbi:tRNA 2-thiocytidine biosynthesis TtcA family protein [Campylobacter pinnipediorum]|uniref:Adenine nucleotide alpha hydrolase, possible tRNA 2-thiocytidine biosynthesis protein n=1 Tax=Campylobacter pinnipediorum subsp. caledonicus TaxID=1874362 RepID=A0A1S6U8G8_9BACT|nr:tRNA 2-thiocytidine biosynthesis TtcA family protein [Campylobacter pinnipediorum]AQW83222.1 adenine nucleotide alpha hydrolase, possible tRNA 2-thiocytidine biosynthesis protein [Campylobacter pinnipediorum subsp. pinnipediorum]AQW86392.1 adenine nucleotide alpha hydrolase, possible tRNA 2-thiocytidine biosynthesis protein [Campylobacter pinnipediorum subsp. caledonicus]AQW88044.1 adenine nucleotide alpha hydrolase, possible tRNA 2-thiocytidine biosynthesis protein [Campylobacter pinnipedior